MRKSDLARQGLFEAVKLRSILNYLPSEVICPIDAALKLDIVVRLEKLSIEGLYLNVDTPQIFLSAERPSGRIAFSCSHEIGHHRFGHGTRADVILGNEAGNNVSSKPEEFLADSFASGFTMPESLASSIFFQRKVSARTATPQEIYIIAGILGVGYGALVNQLAFTQKEIDMERRSQLLKIQPKKIRQSLINKETNGELFLVDNTWRARTIDLRKGDWLLLPPNFEFGPTNEVKFVQELNGLNLYRAVRTGIGNFHDKNSDWFKNVRVSKHNYLGLAEFRHFDDEDEVSLDINDEVTNTNDYF
jgi:Zn-dependent peptidase ImmA (M78 family)